MSEITVAVGAVIEDRGRVLLVRHVPERGGFWAGKWICPGGKLKPGERMEEGVKREVLEETGLRVRLKRALLPFERIVKEGEKVVLHVIYIDWLAEIEGGELSPSSDVGEAIWVEKKKLPEMTDELHEDTVRLFKICGFL